jgi:hypothetical protein
LNLSIQAFALICAQTALAAASSGRYCFFLERKSQFHVSPRQREHRDALDTFRFHRELGVCERERACKCMPVWGGLLSSLPPTTTSHTHTICKCLPTACLVHITVVLLSWSTRITHGFHEAEAILSIRWEKEEL